MEILQNLLRTFGFFLDNIIYGLIPQIYKLFIYLSEINLFSDKADSPIQNLVNHIYVLLGIFMLFKVSFSLLQYIVDPNSFRDSSKGMGKLITNVLVALVLLVSVPSIFGFAMKIQSEIVQSNAIGQLILGTSAGSDYPVSSDGSISSKGVEQMAKDLQFMLYGAFYKVNPKVMDDGRLLVACAGSSGVLGSADMAETDCLNSLQDNLPEDATANGVSLYSFFKYQEDGKIEDDRDFSHFDKLLWWKDDGDYVIDYLPIISLAAGIYVIFLLISFSFDIAVRAIKLCFLQMIAPIAIVSYVDPKESISNGKLNLWIKESASTYFSLFLRLATIFLVMLLISMISSTLLSNGEYITGLPDDESYNIWIYLFLVIGAFMFAKQVPNIIEKIFDIKGSGEFSLNPFKNVGVGAIAGGTLGLGVGIAGFATGSGIGRIATGTLGGFKAGLEGKKISEITNMQADANRRLGMAKANGSTFFGRMGARVSSTLGTPGSLGRTAKEKAHLERDKRNAELELAESRRNIALNKTTTSSLDAMRERAIKKIQEGRGKQGSYYQNLLRQATEAETQGHGAYAEELRQNAQKYLYTKGADEYVTENLNNNDPETADMALKSLYDNALANASLSGHDSLMSRDGNALDSLSKKISSETSAMQTKNIPAEQKIKDIDEQISNLRDKEQVQRSDIEAVQGKEGGPRGYYGPRYGRGRRGRGPRR